MQAASDLAPLCHDHDSYDTGVESPYLVLYSGQNIRYSPTKYKITHHLQHFRPTLFGLFVNLTLLCIYFWVEFNQKVIFQVSSFVQGI